MADPVSTFAMRFMNNPLVCEGMSIIRMTSLHEAASGNSSASRLSDFEKKERLNFASGSSRDNANIRIFASIKSWKKCVPYEGSTAVS